MTDDSDLGRMRALLRGAPLIDGHNDLAWALRDARDKAEPGDEPPDLERGHGAFQTDLPRLRAGGVGGQFWSVYVRSDIPEEQAVVRTFEQFDEVFELVRRHPRHLELARTADDVERIAGSGRIASLIGVEGGHSIGSSLGVLRVLARLGAGYLTLTHNDDTGWADSATGAHPHGGLTAFGEEVVRELNRLGVLVDLSHVSPDTMRHAIQVSDAPAFFSHSSARAISDVTRNVPDDVLELVAEGDGVVMVTFVPEFLTEEGAELNREGWEETRRVRAENPDDPDAAYEAMEAWFNEHPVKATVDDVANHIDHVRDVAGVTHIGIGGDFDGSQDMPEGLTDVSGYPALFLELTSRGYSDEGLAGIAGRNVLRVMRAAEEVAVQLA